jgi:hypothetical protein
LPKNAACGLRRFNPLQWRKLDFRGESMWKLIFCIIVMATAPVWSQTKPAVRGLAAHVDPCAPIGQTANRELVYSMSCNNLPAPPPLPPQAVAPAPPPEPEVERTGIFGMSFDRRPSGGPERTPR